MRYFELGDSPVLREKFCIELEMSQICHQAALALLEPLSVSQMHFCACFGFEILEHDDISLLLFHGFFMSKILSRAG